ncbi:MAG: hypothetical protein AB9872_11180 [Solidesulfovibrio sp.]
MLRRFVVASSLALAVLAMGCASADPHADNKPQIALDADYNDCESRAYVSTAFVRTAGEAEEKHEAIIDACMQEKGYLVK